MITYLVPLLLMGIWLSFMISQKLATKLSCLLFLSGCLPMFYMDLHKSFWPCGLLMILFSTGLMVVFAYIVSIHTEEHHQRNSLLWASLMVVLTSMVSLVLLKDNHMEYFIYNSQLVMGSVSVSLLTSLCMIFLLLFLVVAFVRLVYSKGGGFRKKF